MTDRGPDGRFTQGSKGGPGRKPLQVSESVASIIDSAVTAEDWQKIAGKLRDLALRGNLTAINALFDRRFGKPTERKEVTGANGNELLIRILDANDTDD